MADTSSVVPFHAPAIAADVETPHEIAAQISVRMDFLVATVFARVETIAQLDTSGPVSLWAIREPAQVPKDVRVVGMMLTR